ncbi:MAG: TVP38/TMEM64 family protein [Paracoccaceae bacterium]|nr:TVP38/TMEM64 family protein [Paracoccaceae bacterium]
MTDETTTKRLDVRKAIPLALIVVVAVVGAFTLRDVLTFETLRDNSERLTGWRDANYALVALGYVAIYTLIVAFSLPGGAVMTLAGGFVFGIMVGAPLTVVAATLGATAIFLAAKTGLGDVLHARFQKKAGDPGLMNRIEQGLRENEVSYLLLMRLVPAIPFFLANLAPAFLGVGLRNFVLTTFFGIIPGTVVYSSVGAGLGEVFARGESPDLGIIFEWHILGPILGLCALAALPIIINHFRGRRNGKDGTVS